METKPCNPPRGRAPLQESRTKIPLARPIIDETMQEAAIDSLRNERLVLGESVYKFEEEFARYCGVNFAISTSSGTSAMTLSMIALEVQGGEVLTSPASFVASANCILLAGAQPKFADINLDTYTIDPSKARSSVSTKTRAILPIHLYGFPAAMDELCEIASNRGIAVVEDACQAHGALYIGRKVGSFGTVGCFSFYSSKNMTVAGDGGMVVTNDRSIAEIVQSLRDSGRLRGNRYVHDRIGETARLNTVQAAIGRIQLKNLDAWNERRRRLAKQYDDALSGQRQVVTPPKPNASAMPVYHLYVLRCEERDGLRNWLEKAGIETAVHYTQPIHLQPIYQQMFGYSGGEFPDSENLCHSALSIPMHPSLSDDDITYVSDAVREFYNGKSG